MPSLVTRNQWGARQPEDNPIAMPTPSKRLWLHHTATDRWHGKEGMRDCQNFHMNVRNYNDIAYSFLVDTDGLIYVGRGAGVVGAHTEGDNSHSHAICAMGNFNSTHPTSKLIVAIASLVQFGHAYHWWPKELTGGHRDAPGANTECPGDLLYSMIPEINQLALGDDLLTPEEHDWLGRIHHEVAAGDTSAKTVTQMLQDVLANQRTMSDRLAAIEAKIKV